MKLNAKKSKAMLFNRGRNIDLEPKVRTPNMILIEYTSRTKLLGVVINDSITTWDNNHSTETKAYGRIWILKKLVNQGFPKIT